MTVVTDGVEAENPDNIDDDVIYAYNLNANIERAVERARRPGSCTSWIDRLQRQSRMRPTTQIT